MPKTKKELTKRISNDIAEIRCSAAEKKSYLKLKKMYNMSAIFRRVVVVMNDKDSRKQLFKVINYDDQN